MKSNKSLPFSILEGIAYGILGTIFVVAILTTEQFVRIRLNQNNGFGADYGRETLGILWIFFGLSISAVLGNVFFRDSAKSFLFNWSFILTTSSVMTVVFQEVFSIYDHGASTDKLLELFRIEQECIGLWWIMKLFIILTPFTILFANRHFLFEKIKNLNSLK